MSRKKLKTSESFEKREVNHETAENSNDEVAIGKVISSTLFPKPFWHKLHAIETQMSVELKQIEFPKSIAAVYNPLEYAEAIHCEYMSKYLDGKKKILFVGMNPGPFGMCQTGVPFGHVPTVRDWMKLTSDVRKPDNELAARPIEGLSCDKIEQSGLRWWGLIKKLCNTPEQFFKNCFIYNYCPLAFFGASGKNITPAELKGEPKIKLQEICNNHLKNSIELFESEIIVSIGRYADDRVKELIKKRLINENIKTLCIAHPSPRSLNNTDWPIKAEAWFEENGFMRYFKD